MHKRLSIFILLIVLISLSTVRAEKQAAINPFAPNSVLYNIEQDYLLNNITLDNKVILQVKSIKQLEKVPIQYKSTSFKQSEFELRGATIALTRIKRIWNELDQSTKDFVNIALSRTATEFTYISSSGYFKLHYDTTGVDSIIVEDTNSNSIPDFIENCASYCDSSMDKQISMGYMLPPSDGSNGGDSLYDVYFENISAYGYAFPEGLGSNPWNDYYSYLVLNNDFIGFPSNDDPEGDIAGAAKATIAHEFHHAIQFGYDISEDSWAMESGATFMEEAVFDQVNDNYNYLDDFLGSPHTSLMSNVGLHQYGAFLWQLYLAQNFDTTIHVSAWEAARFDDLFTAYSDTLLDNFGWDIDSAYIDFTYWMFNSATKDDGAHFTEGSDYYPISISNSHMTYPVGITNSLASVGGYGASYVTFYPGAEIGKLKLTFNGSNTRDWSVYVIKSTTENSHTIEFMTLDSVQKTGEIIIEDFDSYHSVTLVGVNTDEFSSGVLFTYSAEVLLPFEVSSTVLSPADSFIYAGDTRQIELLVRNDAVVNDIFNVIYWDNQGWLPQDTFALAIPALDSAIVTINLTAPQGTPVGTASQLSFKSESWGDSTIYDIQTKITKISLYRGDVDFSGSIDISDLVYLVDFAFTGGPAPLPNILSGDLDCADGSDISDLVYLVDLMFNNGPDPLCNPY